MVKRETPRDQVEGDTSQQGNQRNENVCVVDSMCSDKPNAIRKARARNVSIRQIVRRSRRGARAVMMLT
jgi:hypothetical protein